MAHNLKRGHMWWTMDDGTVGWVETRSLLKAFCKTVDAGREVPRNWLVNIAGTFRARLAGESLDRLYGFIAQNRGKPPLDEMSWPDTLEGRRDNLLAHNVRLLVARGNKMAEACASAASDWNAKYALQGFPEASARDARNAWVFFAPHLRNREVLYLVLKHLTNGHRLSDAYRFAARDWNRTNTARIGRATANKGMVGRVYRSWPSREDWEADMSAARAGGSPHDFLIAALDDVIAVRGGSRFPASPDLPAALTSAPQMALRDGRMTSSDSPALPRSPRARKVSEKPTKARTTRKS